MENGKRTYQGISSYDGTLSGKQQPTYDSTLYGKPEYRGIEYDWEVPDNLVVGSPGGVSTIHHHYTHGFYGRGNTSSDIYAGQGERYNSGIYGNLYQTGQEAGQAMGYYPDAPDYKFWLNGEPSQYAYSQSQSNTWAPSMKMYDNPGAYETEPGTNDQKKSLTKSNNVEKYTPSENTNQGEDAFELLDGGQVENYDIPNSEEEKAKEFCIGTTVKPWILFLFLIMTFIVVAFWSESALLFIRQRFHDGRDPSWKRAILYSVILTFIFGVIVWLSGFPITQVD